MTAVPAYHLCFLDVPGERPLDRTATLTYGGRTYHLDFESTASPHCESPSAGVHRIEPSMSDEWNIFTVVLDAAPLDEAAIHRAMPRVLAAVSDPSYWAAGASFVPFARLTEA